MRKEPPSPPACSELTSLLRCPPLPPASSADLACPPVQKDAPTAGNMRSLLPLSLCCLALLLALGARLNLASQGRGREEKGAARGVIWKRGKEREASLVRRGAFREPTRKGHQHHQQLFSRARSHKWIYIQSIGRGNQGTSESCCGAPSGT